MENSYDTAVSRTEEQSNEAAGYRGPDIHVDQVRVRVLPGNRVDRKNAARALNRSPKTLAEWRRLGLGPRPYNIGGRVFYDWGDVQAFAQGKVA